MFNGQLQPTTNKQITHSGTSIVWTKDLDYLKITKKLVDTLSWSILNTVMMQHRNWLEH